MGRVTRNTVPSQTFLAACKEMGEFNSKVGWLEGKNYPDGTSVAYVATIQEFGDPSHNIPPRPFMRTTIVERQKEWAALMARLSARVVTGKMTVYQAYEGLGLQAAGDVRLTISQIQDPPLSPITIAIRARLKQDGRSKISGAGELGRIAKQIDTIDVSGVSVKPLVFSSLLLSSCINGTYRS